MQARAQRARGIQAKAPRPPVDLWAVAAGIVTSFAVTVLVSVALAATIYFTDLTEGSVSRFLYYVALVTVMAGGAVAGRRSEGRGWLHGGLAGVGYVVISLVVGGVLFPGSAVLGGAAGKVATAFVAGAIGGVVGVNL